MNSMPPRKARGDNGFGNVPIHGIINIQTCDLIHDDALAAGGEETPFIPQYPAANEIKGAIGSVESFCILPARYRLAPLIKRDKFHVFA